MDLVLLVKPRFISTNTNLVEYEKKSPKTKRMMSGKSAYIVETKYVVEISSVFTIKKFLLTNFQRLKGKG